MKESECTAQAALYFVFRHLPRQAESLPLEHGYLFSSVNT